jgi:hypothetical protein
VGGERGGEPPRRRRVVLVEDEPLDAGHVPVEDGADLEEPGDDDGVAGAEFVGGRHGGVTLGPGAFPPQVILWRVGRMDLALRLPCEFPGQGRPTDIPAGRPDG